MKSVFMLIFILSLGSAIYLGLESFDGQKPKSVSESPFQKNSLADQVYLDFADLKKNKQLPAQIYDVSGYFVTDQRSNQSVKLNRDIISALKLITPPRGDGLFEIDLIIFDTSQDKDPSQNKKTKKEPTPTLPSKALEKTQLVFQFSIIEKKTKNKVAEIGRTYSAE